MHEGLSIVAGVTGSILAIGTFTAVVWKKIIKPLVKIEEALPTLHEIHSQFSNNGGSSLKDQIDDINHQVRNIRQVLNVHVEAEELLNGHMHKRITDVEGTLHQRAGDTEIPAQRRRKSDMLRSDYDGTTQDSGA